MYIHMLFYKYKHFIQTLVHVHYVYMPTSTDSKYRTTCSPSIYYLVSSYCWFSYFFFGLNVYKNTEHILLTIMICIHNVIYTYAHIITLSELVSWLRGGSKEKQCIHKPCSTGHHADFIVRINCVRRRQGK